MRAIYFSEYFTAVEADIFAGSELSPIPSDGIVVIRAASTVNTATLAVSTNIGAPVSPARGIPLRANAEIRQSEDQPWIVPVKKGCQVLAVLGGTTGTCRVEATFVGKG